MSSSSDDDAEGIVFDIGTHRARMGIAGEDSPEVNITYWSVPEFQKRYFEKFSLFDSIKFDTETFDEVIASCLKWGRIDEDQLKQRFVMFTEHLHRLESEREKLMELMFEKYQSPAFYIAPSPVLAMYSSGRGTGIVFECGNSYAETAAIYESHLFTQSINLEKTNGSTISSKLRAKINENEAQVDDAGIIALKEEYFSCSDKEQSKMLLPDGNEVQIDGKVLLDKDLGETTFANFVYEGIMSTSVHCRRDLFTNIILSGGTTLTSGFPDALKNGITNIVDNRHRGKMCKVIAAPERSYSPWIGGSILASLSCFMNSLIVTKQMYEESGNIRVQRFFINPEKMD